MAASTAAPTRRPVAAGVLIEFDRLAFVSGIDSEADGLPAELFVLQPEGSDQPSRLERAEL
jgi:hypothetical protein